MLAPARRILVISSSSVVWGGSEELWFAAVDVLRERGLEVDVVKPHVDLEHPRLRRLVDIGCRVHELPSLDSGRRHNLANTVLPGRLQLDLIRRQQATVARVLLTRRPAMTIVSQGENFDGMFLTQVCRKLRQPYVLVSQKASELEWPLDGLRPLVIASYSEARAAVFVSEHNRKVSEEQIGAHLSNAVVLRNPVLVGKAARLAWPPSSEVARLACLARLDPSDKGQDLLLRLLADGRWATRRLEVTFAGTGKQSKGLRQLAGMLGVSSARFVGQVADVESLWRENELLVLPSRTEGLPLALVEAMMCGRPAVVTDVGGNAEVMIDDLTGWVAAAPTVAALDEAMERAWAARARWPDFGAAASEHIRAVFPDDGGSRLAALVGAG
jgi:glycosyltransferase involved in cell wall biosynthesis